MVKESFIIRTVISSQLMKRTLLTGFAIALIGILGLLLGGIFLSLLSLQTWGLTLFLLSLGLITWGLLPYRRLSSLQLKPNEFSLVDADHLAFYAKGKKMMTIPLKSIDRLSYISQATLYGIAFWLKPQPASPVIIHQRASEVYALRQKGHQLGADLFFPYFNQRAYDELVEWYQEERIDQRPL
jgi:hypothetical protein